MAEPVWLSLRTMLVAHERLVAEHGGQKIGFNLVRLSMALAWPQSVLALAGRPLRAADLAAAQAEGMLRLRPFEQGNERMTFLVAMLFLALNHRPLVAPKLEKLAVFRAFCGGFLSREGLADWLRLQDVAAYAPANSAVVRLQRNKAGEITRVSALKKRAPAQTKQAAALTVEAPVDAVTLDAVT